MFNHHESHPSEAQGDLASGHAGVFILPGNQGHRIVAPRRNNSSAERLDMPRIVAHYEHEALAMRRKLLAGMARAAANAMQRVATSLRTELKAPLRVAPNEGRDA